jgi:transcription termination factor Rho
MSVPPDMPATSGVAARDEAGRFVLRGECLLPTAGDLRVPAGLARRAALREGDLVVATLAGGRRASEVASIERVMGLPAALSAARPRFESLTPVHPFEQLRIESSADTTRRLIDLVSPLGKGQRALVVSPPKAGKTSVLRAIAAGVAANHPEALLMVVLVGERPEEVTEMRRSINGRVYASTFDEPAEHHVALAELALEMACRAVELRRDVVVLLDSITRLARAYNLAQPSTGRTLSGGIDPAALYPPKRFFGAARKLEEGGSLTIVASALVDTGSRMDDVIYEEFKGTGNCELILERRLAEKRIFPAIDVARSGTRREELLLGEERTRRVWLMRRMLAAVADEAGYELLLRRLGRSPTNDEFLAGLTSGG